MDVLGYRQGHYPFDRAPFLPWDRLRNGTLKASPLHRVNNVLETERQNKGISLFVIHSISVPLLGIRTKYFFLQIENYKQKKERFHRER